QVHYVHLSVKLSQLYRHRPLFSIFLFFFFSSRRRHTRFDCDWSSDVCSSDLAEAKRKLDGALYDLVVTDIKMPNTDGIEVLRYAHQVSPDSAVILITAVDDYEAAVQAVKAGGASDYIRKGPGLVDEIKLAIRRSLENVNLSRQNLAFKRDAASRNSLDNIIGASAAMEK